MNEFKIKKGLIVQGLLGQLFSVNDMSGTPIMEVFSDNIRSINLLDITQFVNTVDVYPNIPYRIFS